MNALIRYLVLPATVTDFERNYLARVNRIALGFFALHVPGLMLLAWGNDTRPWLAGVLSLLALTGPAIAYRNATSPRTVSIVYGMSAMFFGALLVHFGQGPAQIEMHFYFFALLAMLAVFGNPMVVVAATVTVALHHVLLWALLPKSVFNYDAPLWVVAVHAAFVVLEAVAASFIARSFFDNVIGLERIVQERTREIDGQRQDMRRVLDHVGQGLVTVGRDGSLSLERSRQFDAWFTAAPRTLFDALATWSPSFASSVEAAWGQVIDGFLPIEVAIDQIPKTVSVDGAHYEIGLQPIGDAEAPERFLVVISDVTGEVDRERSERERREVLQVFERILSDRAGAREFFEEGAAIVAGIERGDHSDLVLQKRRIHTLKGNCAIFGLMSVSALCHDLETALEEGDALPTELIERIVGRWRAITGDFDRLLGAQRAMVEIDETEHAEIARAAAAVSHGLGHRIAALRFEPARRRLGTFAEQARRLATQLDKEIEVRVEDQGVRVDGQAFAPFWSALVHAVRNAVDHGIERPDERTALEKPARGSVVLRAARRGDDLVVEVEDDGRGIDWVRVREKARALGRATDTREALEDALFADGVSTAESVTDVSGRGVGMGALREVVLQRGGTIRIKAAAGRGTTLTARFPLLEVAGEVYVPGAETEAIAAE